MYRTRLQRAIDEVLAPRLAQSSWKRRGSRGFVRRSGRSRWLVKLIHGEYRQNEGPCRITAKVMRLGFPPFTPQAWISTIVRHPMLWREWNHWEEWRLIFATRRVRRLGELTEVGEHFWYAFDAGSDQQCEAALAELAKDVETFAVPWLESRFWRAPPRDTARKKLQQAHFTALGGTSPNRK